MRIVLIRHGRVLVEWKKSYTPAGYDAENELYDRSPIAPLEPIDIPIEKVYVSTLPRTEATAAFLVGEKRLEKTSLINEVPIRSPFDSARSWPVHFLNFLATLQWHGGSRRQRETRARTDLRIDAFLDKIEAEGEDCIVVGHGIYFYEMMKIMKRRGYSGEPRRYMRNGEIVEFRREPAAEPGGCGLFEAGLPCPGGTAERMED